jgi:hypothetical protein
MHAGIYPDALLLRLLAMLLHHSVLVVMVLKKYGSWHMCPDYRELNNITNKDMFPIPFIY